MLGLSFLKGDKAMSEKRRDNRNRILHEGEYQRADGRYRFRYVDIHGNEGNLYSWRLDHNDPIPKGKKMELSLREKEKQLEPDMFSGLVLGGGGFTVLELVEKYVSLKIGVRQSTYAGYKTVINLLKKDDFGKKRIDKVKLSDAKAWLIKLQRVDGKGYSSIHTIRGVLRPAFQMAEEDDLIRKNPFGFELVNVIVNDSVRREAVTRKQEREFLRFIKEDAHFCKYYDAIFILFNTGLRISDDDDKIRLNQRKPSKYKGLRRFGPEKNLQRINKFMKERPIFYKNLIQMKENIRFYLRCFYCITKVMILQFNSENRTELARNG